MGYTKYTVYIEQSEAGDELYAHISGHPATVEISFEDTGEY
jgi:hypothetical protein